MRIFSGTSSRASKFKLKVEGNICRCQIVGWDREVLEGGSQSRDQDVLQDWESFFQILKTVPGRDTRNSATLDIPPSP